MIYLTEYESKGLSRQEEYKLQKEVSKLCLYESLKRTLNREVSPEEIFKGAHGKPYLKNSEVFFNVTNCTGLVCCAVHSSEIGIDAESIINYSPELTKRVCTNNEAKTIDEAENKAEMFIRFWTLKESYVKYIGIGLGYGLENAEFSFCGEKPVCVSSPHMKIVQKDFLHLQSPAIMSVCTEDEFCSEICRLTIYPK